MATPLLPLSSAYATSSSSLARSLVLSVGSSPYGSSIARPSILTVTFHASASNRVPAQLNDRTHRIGFMRQARYASIPLHQFRPAADIRRLDRRVEVISHLTEAPTRGGAAIQPSAGDRTP